MKRHRPRTRPAVRKPARRVAGHPHRPDRLAYLGNRAGTPAARGDVSRSLEGLSSQPADVIPTPAPTPTLINPLPDAATHLAQPPESVSPADTSSERPHATTRRSWLVAVLGAAAALVLAGTLTGATRLHSGSGHVAPDRHTTVPAPTPESANATSSAPLSSPPGSAALSSAPGGAPIEYPLCPGCGPPGAISAVTVAPTASETDNHPSRTIPDATGAHPSPALPATSPAPPQAPSLNTAAPSGSTPAPTPGPPSPSTPAATPPPTTSAPDPATVSTPASPTSPPPEPQSFFR
jgi:hypothetical protein